jgi:hypothetical protein
MHKLMGSILFGFCILADISYGQSTRTLDSFASLRAEILTRIGNANSRVWLATNFLTDGEIVTGLYVAKFRHVDVNVLLGSAKAHHFTSRLRYLQDQNIPVSLRPRSFFPAEETVALFDRTLLFVESDLDYTNKLRRITIRETNDLGDFETKFLNAATGEDRQIPRARPTINAGRASGTGYIYSPPANTGGAYRYQNVRERRPAGVPDKLPRIPIWQKKPSSDDQE